VITDLRSANGVDVGGQRIRGTATLEHGDRVRICDHEFVFEIGQPPSPPGGSDVMPTATH
ncbi:MAG: family transcriptional regulator, regulator of embCAB operon, partial [Mycobacterium sp.]|nr:family transcriptional regulator, regulator of embCAB operon [Mycobacterium sp.]